MAANKTVFLQGSFLCDIILLCMVKKSAFYRDSKFEKITQYVTEACLLEIPVLCTLIKEKYNLSNALYSYSFIYQMSLNTCNCMH